MRALNRKNPIPKNETQKIANEMLVDALMIEKTGWTYHDIMNTPEEFYNDLITIYEIKASIEKIEMDQKKRASKKR